MTRVIGYRRFGGPEVLEEEECALPLVEAGHVCVQVKAAGINPVDYKLFGGLTRPLEVLRTITHPSRWFEKPEQRPLRGVGQDFAGVVTAVGTGVSSFAVGDGVIGLLRSAPWQVRSMGALATEIVVSQEFIVPKPDSVSFEVAGGLGVAAQTAMGPYVAWTRMRAMSFSLEGLQVVLVGSLPSSPFREGPRLLRLQVRLMPTTCALSARSL